ncbi:MAG: lysozyme inhibitor LprI family protein [Pseudomonadota bacterium]
MRVLFAVLFFVIPGAVGAQSPSYSCSGNLNPTERTICRSTTLAQLDVAMANRFYALRDRLNRSDAGRLRAEQDRWRGARDRCDTDAACVGSLYGQRIAELRDWGRVRNPTPAPQPQSEVERIPEIVILPDGTMEKPGPEGSTYQRSPSGEVTTIWPDGSRTRSLFYTNVPYAGLPQLTSNYQPWMDSLTGSLIGILGNILTEEEFAVYQANESGTLHNDYELLDWRLRAINFLTSESSW